MVSVSAWRRSKAARCYPAVAPEAARSFPPNQSFKIGGHLFRAAQALRADAPLLSGPAGQGMLDKLREDNGL